MPDPTLSIVTVTLNNVRGLAMTFRSLARQTSSFQWVVIDGGSTDRSTEFLRRQTRLPCSWTSEPDSGIYDAMNKGLSMISGDYVMFINGGDALASADTVHLIRQALVTRPDLLYGDALETAPGDALLLKKARSHRMKWYGMFAHHQSMVYKSERANAIRYDETFRIAGDYKMTCQLLRQNFNIVRVSFPICVFERGGVSAAESKLGRVEERRVKQEILQMRPSFSWLVQQVQSATQGCKRRAPWIYSRLRFKRIESEMPSRLG